MSLSCTPRRASRQRYKDEGSHSNWSLYMQNTRCRKVIFRCLPTGPQWHARFLSEALWSKTLGFWLVLLTSMRMLNMRASRREEATYQNRGSPRARLVSSIDSLNFDRSRGAKCGYLLNASDACGASVMTCRCISMARHFVVYGDLQLGIIVAGIRILRSRGRRTGERSRWYFCAQSQDHPCSDLAFACWNHGFKDTKVAKLVKAGGLPMSL